MPSLLPVGSMEQKAFVRGITNSPPPAGPRDSRGVMRPAATSCSAATWSSIITSCGPGFALSCFNVRCHTAVALPGNLAKVAIVSMCVFITSVIDAVSPPAGVAMPFTWLGETAADSPRPSLSTLILPAGFMSAGAPCWSFAGRTGPSVRDRPFLLKRD